MYSYDTLQRESCNYFFIDQKQKYDTLQKVKKSYQQRKYLIHLIKIFCICIYCFQAFMNNPLRFCMKWNWKKSKLNLLLNNRTVWNDFQTLLQLTILFFCTNIFSPLNLWITQTDFFHTSRFYKFWDFSWKISKDKKAKEKRKLFVFEVKRHFFHVEKGWVYKW